MASLTPVAQRFILHWGEMGARWGLNRTVAQVHALLYLSPQPLTADDICETLNCARSNVSNALKELQTWKVVRISHVMGDRRDHFETLKDVFEMFRLILAERKRREVDPTLAVLREFTAEAATSPAEDPHTAERLRELTDFFELTASTYEQWHNVPTGVLKQALKLSGKLRGLVGE
jgi:DNA-binding transcriptional regulator GbsR (MarR family)